jgi:cytochrome c oxidase subunit 2
MAEANPGVAMAEPNHFKRFVTMWLVATVVATPLVVLVLGPHLPPGNASVQANGHVTDNRVLMGMATPVLLLVVMYLIYAVVNFRARPGDVVLEGPAIRGNPRLQAVWLITTTFLVLCLAAYGTWRLTADSAGSGSGPSPVGVPSGQKLQVQVIAQEWAFTYRYPSYGGVETSHLVLPDNQLVELHVTSLDVIHSFWAFQLGVKADANPGIDNITYVKPNKLRTFTVRCSELCGVWHGYMFDTGRVVTPATFATWIHDQQAAFAPVTKDLPPYSRTYVPTPTRRGT